MKGAIMHEGISQLVYSFRDKAMDTRAWWNWLFHSVNDTPEIIFKRVLKERF
jgi:hypothetical protein